MIETARLLLRPWRDADREPMHRMGRDPAVMEFLGPLQDRLESDALIDRMIALQAQRGYCFWALERQNDAALIGLCGLKPGSAGTPIAGRIEIGWRLRRDAWGAGYAREAADACLQWAWKNLGSDRIYAITTAGNERSWRLMERLGMRRLPDLDFAHPNVPEESPLKPHVTYVTERPRD